MVFRLKLSRQRGHDGAIDGGGHVVNTQHQVLGHRGAQRVLVQHSLQRCQAVGHKPRPGCQLRAGERHIRRRIELLAANVNSRCSGFN